MALFKIALDFTSLDFANRNLGQYRYSVDLIRGLAALQTDVEFLLLGSRSEPGPELGALFRAPAGRWRYLQMEHARGRGADLLDHLRYSRLLARERVDLLHALHSFVPLLAPCPVVATYYDPMYELFPEYAEARASRPYRVYRWTVKNRVRRVICISGATAADLQRLWGIEEDRVDVVPLALSRTLSLEEEESSIRTSLRELCRPPVLVSPYNLEPRKNLSALLEAFSHLRLQRPDLKLILFGSGAVTPDREQAFEERVRALDIEDGVVRTGFLEDHELAWLYRQATLFVFPSLHEGFGLPVLEAMAAGACVVARNASAMAEVVGPAGVLVEECARRELSEAIGSLLDRPQERQELGEAARVRASSFSVERMARSTLASYLAALNARGSQGVVESETSSLPQPTA